MMFMLRAAGKWIGCYRIASNTRHDPVVLFVGRRLDQDRKAK